MSTDRKSHVIKYMRRENQKCWKAEFEHKNLLNAVEPEPEAVSSVSQELVEIQEPIKEKDEPKSAMENETDKERSHEETAASESEQTEEVSLKVESTIPQVNIADVQPSQIEIEKESESGSSEPKKAFSIDEDSTATVDVHEHDELFTEQQLSKKSIYSFIEFRNFLRLSSKCLDSRQLLLTVTYKTN